MEKNQIRDILLLQEDQKQNEKLIEREKSIKLKENTGNPFIIIISGIRRSGKSTLLNQFRDKKSSYYVNFDDERFTDFTVKDFQKLYEVFIELYGEKDIYFFDEIQNIDNWERFARRLHNQKNKIYITGSNATMLSKETGTHLTGRNIVIELYPFSFKEFLRFKDIKVKKRMSSREKSKIKKYFQEYLDKGGFPEYLHTEKEEYLETLYENILYRDIITRHNLKKERPIKQVVRFAASNIGKPISFNKIREITGLTSATTVKEYFQYLEDSYLTFLVPKYSYSLKKQQYANKKVYLIDTKLSNVIGFRFSDDKGRLLENQVFLQLKRKGKEIYYYKGNKECDFVIKKGNDIVQAIQVSWNLNKKNKKREIQGLLEAMKKFNLSDGLLLTFDQEDTIKEKNKTIHVIPCWKWSLN